MAKPTKDKVSEDLERGKLPRGAMRFVDNQCSSSVFGKDGDETPKLDMTIYTGGIIKGHWYWDDLAIDLGGLSFQSKKTPILENHDTSKKIAFAKNIMVSKEFGVKVDPDKTTFVDTEESREFQKLSKEGFPYQASISVNPSEIQRLGKGETAEVNGFTMKGPDATIFRKAVVNEGSVCVFGWDNKTQSSAFSKEEVDVDIDIIGNMSEGEATPKEENVEIKETELNSNSKEEGQMEKKTLVELEKDYPELLASVRKDAGDAVEAKFKVEKEGLELQIEEGEAKTAILEKKDAIRTAKELKLDADSIFMVAFNASDVPEHLFDKVIAMLNHNKFVTDEVLDVKLWKEACVAEILSWETAGVTDTVMGGGNFSLKDVDSDATDLKKEEEGDDATANSLLSLIGNEKGGE